MIREVDTNWKLPKQVTIVKHINYYIDCGDGKEAPVAYIVFDNDKNQLKSACKWAHKDFINNDDIHIDGNCEFNIKIVKPAVNSSVGGKLSFWYCEIYNDDFDVVIGVNSDMLYNLILNTTFVNGVCQSKVLFIKYYTSLGLTTKDTEYHKLALKSESAKAEFNNTKKTTKWEQGYVYQTETTDTLYLADVYRFVNINQDKDRNIVYEINKNKSHIVISNYYGDLYYLNKKTQEIDIDKLKEDANRNNILCIRIIENFSSKVKAPYKKADVDSLNKIAKKYVKNIFEHALHTDYVFKETIEDTLTSIDGIITEEMINNLRRLSNISNEYRYALDDQFFKYHIVRSGSREFKFITFKEAIECIIDNL